MPSFTRESSLKVMYQRLGPQRGVIQTRAFRAVAYLEAFGCLGGLSLKENAEHWSLSFCSPATLEAVVPFRDTQYEVPSQAQSSVASSHWIRQDHLGTPTLDHCKSQGCFPINFSILHPRSNQSSSSQLPLHPHPLPLCLAPSSANLS